MTRERHCHRTYWVKETNGYYACRNIRPKDDLVCESCRKIITEKSGERKRREEITRKKTRYYPSKYNPDIAIDWYKVDNINE